jgi:two-component system, NarL family, sensor histidine kinase DesK
MSRADGTADRAAGVPAGGGVSVPRMDDAATPPPAGAAHRQRADPQRWSQGWRRTVLAAGMLAYPVVACVGVAQYSAGAARTAGYALAAAFCLVYAAAAHAAVRGGRARLRALVGVLTALFAAEVPLAREYAFFLLAVVVSFSAAFWRRRAVAVVGAGALLCVVVPLAVPSWDAGSGGFEAVAVVCTALTVYAFAEIAETNRELVEARAEVARLASRAERDRIARDLHDLLGHSLTVITVKSALARRLSAAGNAGAAREIAEVETLSRQALADVRAAVSGYRDVTLSAELARGRELLRAAGITAALPRAADGVDPAHRELFGWVVREGLTNVVRHARASRCTVTLAASAVEVRDDGRAGAGDGRPGGDGNGLRGLRERVAAAGGRVAAGPAPGGGWVLRVSMDDATEGERS